MALSSIGGGDLRSPLWLTGPVDVRSAPATCSSSMPRGEADRVARLAQAAVPVVLRVLPDWQPDLVVEVPARPQALDGALDADPGRYDDRGGGDGGRGRLDGLPAARCTSSSTPRCSGASARSGPRW